jgi:hypothetical protein
MSIEYTAPLRLSDGEVDSLCELLVEHGYVLVPSADVRRFALRMPGSLPRAHWPNDADVDVSDSIYVAVHSGTRAERERLVSALHTILARLGHECRLDEE